MKITICIPSNRPIKMRRFLKSIRNLGSLLDSIKISVAAQPPYTEAFFDEFHDVEFTMFDKDEVPRFAMWRASCMRKNSDSDYFILLDDDNQFCDSKITNKMNKSCFDYYSEVFEYMEKNKDVGAMMLCGFFGGGSCGYNFIDHKKYVMGCDSGGFVMRNIGVDKIFDYEEVSGAPGALEESYFGLNILSNGYKYKKRFNCPTKAEKTNMRNPPFFYFDKYTGEHGLLKIIRERHGAKNWSPYDGKFPFERAM